MSDDLLNEIATSLQADYGMKLSPSRLHLRQGVCPQCSKKSLWTYAATPWVIKCERTNKCGAEYKAKELYPDLFDSWTDRFQKVEDAKPEAERNPNAAADAYLKLGRGFDLEKIKGLYTQETYTDQKADHGRGATSATVRFQVADTWWQRLIDKPARFGSKKATFKFGGSYAGWWWALPSINFDAPTPQTPADAPKPPTELWLVEGIFDAIALAHHGIAAVSLMSCNNYPEHALVSLRTHLQHQGSVVKEPKLVWALDTGKAGETFTVKHVKRARQDGWICDAAQPPVGRNKLDWNDLHQLGRLEEQHLAEYRYQGALLIAATAQDKALLIYNHTGRPSFDFVHANRWYWLKVDVERYNKAVLAIEEDIEKGNRPNLNAEELRTAALRESNTLQPICNCNPEVLYYQKNDITQEAWYYFRVRFPSDASEVKGTFTAGQLTSAPEFKKQLLHMAPGAWYTGSGPQLESILSRQTTNPKIVETVDFVGYSKKHKAYLLGDQLTVHDGDLIEPNAEDYFEIGRTSVKTLQRSIRLDLNTDPATYNRDWIGHLWAAYGTKGIVALTYFFGSLFAEQIREEQESFPFLEIVGAPGAGKTTLIKFLWKLLGRNGYEGFDPNKSTSAGRLRTFSQVSNLPIVLIESDRESKDAGRPAVRSFDWDELKDTYNGNPIRTMGVKTGGNETYDPPFRASIVISQNNPVDASQALMERICHLFFTMENHTMEGLEHGRAMEKADTKSLSGFLVEAVKREADVMAILKERTTDETNFLLQQDGIRHIRMAKNHGQQLALLHALRRVIRLSDAQYEATRGQIIVMTRERQAAVNADHQVCVQFWETFDFLDGLGHNTPNGHDPRPTLDHSRDPALIAVNLNEFLEAAANHRQQVPLLVDLKKHLKTGKSRRFIEVKSVSSAISDRVQTDGIKVARTVHCWVFARPGQKARKP
jgi:energy-coupling factor transporter ATP-binding protein EcfA2